MLFVWGVVLCEVCRACEGAREVTVYELEGLYEIVEYMCSYGKVVV